MGAVAAINFRTADGKTAHIMNYHDGHAGSTGAMLVSFYNTPEKIKALIKCGDLISLEQKLPNKEFISAVEKEVNKKMFGLDDTVISDDNTSTSETTTTSLQK